MPCIALPAILNLPGPVEIWVISISLDLCRLQDSACSWKDIRSHKLYLSADMKSVRLLFPLWLSNQQVDFFLLSWRHNPESYLSSLSIPSFVLILCSSANVLMTCQTDIFEGAILPKTEIGSPDLYYVFCHISALIAQESRMLSCRSWLLGGFYHVCSSLYSQHLEHCLVTGYWHTSERNGSIGVREKKNVHSRYI